VHVETDDAQFVGGGTKNLILANLQHVQTRRETNRA